MQANPHSNRRIAEIVTFYAEQVADERYPKESRKSGLFGALAMVLCHDMKEVMARVRKDKEYQSLLDAPQ